MKLHLGCGYTRLDDYVNIDISPGSTVDVALDLDKSEPNSMPWEDDSVDSSMGLHFLEHLHNPLPSMQELWRVTKPEGLVEFAVPYGSSDDAWEDQTHVRPYFVGSWHAFSQPYYWRGDYNYTADWRCDQLILDVDEKRWTGADANDVFQAVMVERNVVKQMAAYLVCVKPAREAKRELLTKPKVEIRLT